MTYRNITQSSVNRIARRYDLDPHSTFVREHAEQADQYHCHDGSTSAENLLDGYLQEMTRCHEAEANAHRDFCRDAY